jgi:hypothetical protein
MFDTVRCRYTVVLDIGLFQQLQKKLKEKAQVIINESLNRDTGELSFNVIIKGHKIPFIRYFSNSATLLFEVSIPNYINGNNVKMIQKKDIQTFYKELQRDFEELLGVTLIINQIVCTRLHVCYNVDISESGFSMIEWLKYINHQNIPYKPLVSSYRGKNKRMTGVTFRANQGSQARLTFYDKESERPHEKEAKNILRIEVKTSRDERKKFGIYLVDLLEVKFFSFIMEKYKINEILRNKFKTVETSSIDYQNLIHQHEYKIHKIERILGFLKIYDDMKENTSSLYGQRTYQDREKEVGGFYELIQVPKAVKVPQIELQDFQ